MSDYEIVDVETPRPAPSGADGGRDPGSKGPSPWLLAVPILLVALVVGALSRGGSDPGEEVASPEPNSSEPTEEATPVTEARPTRPPNAEPIDNPDSAKDRLLASFDHLGLLTGGPEEPVRVVSLSGETLAQLPLTGRPLAFVDPWLVLHRSGAIVVIDVSAADSEPVSLISLDRTPSEVLAWMDFDSLVVAAIVEQSSPEAQVFDVGSWELNRTVNLNYLWRSGVTGPTSISGSGVFENGSRVADGSLLGANRRRAVVRQCRGFDECQIVIYDRDGWAIESRLENSFIPANFQLNLAPERMVGLLLDFTGQTWIVDLDEGTKVELEDSGREFGFSPPLAVSSEALLLGSYNESMALADRATGRIYRTTTPTSFGETFYQGLVIVDLDRPLIEAARENSDG